MPCHTCRATFHSPLGHSVHNLLKSTTIRRHPVLLPAATGLGLNCSSHHYAWLMAFAIAIATTATAACAATTAKACANGG